MAPTSVAEHRDAKVVGKGVRLDYGPILLDRTAVPLSTSYEPPVGLLMKDPPKD